MKRSLYFTLKEGKCELMDFIGKWESLKVKCRAYEKKNILNVLKGNFVSFKKKFNVCFRFKIKRLLLPSI